LNPGREELPVSGSQYAATQRRSSLPGRPSWAIPLRALLAAALLWLAPLHSQIHHEIEAEELKAAYLYSFAKFVEWPESAWAEADAPIVIGVLADASLADALARMAAGKTIQGRTVEVREFSGPENLQVCHVLFIGDIDKRSLQTVLFTVEGWPVLTVADKEAFTQLGGVVEMFLQDRKFRFDINAGAARRSGLRISSQLLKLARRVGEG
jgi:hypothetical protein